MRTLDVRKLNRGLHKNVLRVLAWTLAVVTFGCSAPERTPCKYLIPDGYVGWVRITYEVPEADPVPVLDGHRVFKFPDSGVIDTRSSVELGTVSDLFYYVTADGQLGPLSRDLDGGMIWGGYNSGSAHEGFFVGTQEQFEALDSNSDAPGPLVGAPAS